MLFCLLYQRNCYVKHKSSYATCCWMSYMATFTSESMFGFQNGYMVVQIDVLFPQKRNMVFQIDVEFPTWEHDVPSRCWISKMGIWFSKSMLDVNSHIGFKQWVQT